MEVGSQITFGGLASGIDTRAIIDALLDVERIPGLRLQNKKAQLSSQDSIFANLDSRLDDLRSAIEGLDTRSELGSYSASSSDELILGAVADGSALQGNYNIDVLSLAAAESRATDGFADKDATNVGSGTFDITVDGVTTTVDLSDPENTLEDVASAINSADAGVTASIIDTGDPGGNPYRLVVSSDEAGSTGAFSLDSTRFTPTSAAFNIDDANAASSRLQQGTDAHLQVNGLDVYRSSNSFSDVIDGVTLDLNSASPGTTVQVSVEKDVEGIKANLQEFVDAYNDLATIFDQQSQVNDEGETSAALFGDSGLRSIQSRLRGVVSGEVSGSSSLYDTLASIGITSDANGKLSLDGSDLEDALDADFDGVMDLFLNETDGIATEVKSTVDELTNSSNGIIKIRRDGIASRQSSLDDRISRLDDRLGRFEERLIRQYATMETLISSYQAQGASIGF